MAMDGEGNAIAVWCEEKLAATNSIYARRYNVSSDQWQDAQEIDNLDGGAMSPIIAMDSNGNGTVLWRQFYNTRYNIFTVRYE